MNLELSEKILNSSDIVYQWQLKIALVGFCQNKQSAC
jgi:hypothetical protein